MKPISGLKSLLAEMDPDPERRAAELMRRNEALRAELKELREECAELRRGLAAAELGIRNDREAYRAALNLIEDAVEARRVAQAEIAERRHAEAELRATGQHKDEFLAMLAHELRTPLSSMRNGLYLMRQPGDAVEGAPNLQAMMDRQIVHMARLVDDLMDVARIGQGKIQLCHDEVDLVAVARSALEMCESLLQKSGIEPELDLPDGPLIVNGDAVRLTQVFANLLNNAAKFTEPGGRIWIRARAEGEAAAMIVRDSGAGIPADMLPRIFDLFAQVDRTFARAQGGLGIGLTLARRLIDLHGGTIEARSDGPGLGSEFRVVLPLRAEESTAVPGDGATHADAPARILLVDDSRDAAESLSKLLRHLGHDVRVANDGRTALETLSAFRPSLMLLDIGMPGMDGHEVARRARQRPEGEGLTLVALTGWGPEDEQHRFEESGFHHHLMKPVDLDRLRALLADVEAKGRFAMGERPCA